MYTVDPPDSANAYRVLGVLLIAAPFVVAQVTGIASFFLSPPSPSSPSSWQSFRVIIFGAS